MTGGGAGIPLKYIALKGQAMIQDHEPTVVNNYPSPTYHRMPPEQQFSAPERLEAGEETVEYEYLVNFLTGADHLHAEHVELGDTWTILFMRIELEDGGTHLIRSAQRTALIADIDRVPKSVIDKEADAMVEKGLDELLGRNEGNAA